VAGGDRRNADSMLVAQLAAGAEIAGAARAAGVSEATVYRRLREPDFKEKVAGARAELVSRTVGQLADAGSAAAQKLTDLLNAKSEYVRLGAARAILELGSKLRETEELEQRIAALEALQKGETP
jgi:hypothetical protein